MNSIKVDAEYCSKCFDGQVDEVIAESEAT
jgi:hypothetical protein